MKVFIGNLAIFTGLVSICGILVAYFVVGHLTPLVTAWAGG